MTESCRSPGERISEWLREFNAALEAGSPAAAANLFAAESYWRDLVALTWNVKTVGGAEGVRRMLEATMRQAAPRKFEMDGEAAVADGCTESFLRFETGAARGIGHLRIDRDRAVTLLTAMDELKGHEEALGPDRPTGVEHGAIKGRSTWLEDRICTNEQLGIDRQPYALIVGGGQGGIALAARLKQLRVPALVIERNARLGDSWRNRYRTLVLHDPVWYDHLPYMPFPENWPVFTPKDKMGDWLEAYATIMELDCWSSTNCTRATYDDSSSEWIVEAVRSGRPVTLRPKHLVLCTGAYGPPRMPELDGAELFKGTALHSSGYDDGKNFRGKRCVVIGSNTSAHDICADLWECGAESVAMVQRSPSTVVRSDTLLEVVFGDLYSERALQNGISTERADVLFSSLPFAMLEERMKSAADEMERRDASLLERLKAAGFLLDNGTDGTGLVMKAFRTGSGYYIDVGCSELIADKKVKLHAGTEPIRFTRDGLELRNGARLQADAVIFATGYHSMQRTISDLISPEVAEKIGHCWGYGSGTPGDPGPWEGEMRNLWKPNAQDGLWLHGGNLHLSRFFSKYVALQIKARMEGIPTPVYGKPSSNR